MQTKEGSVATHHFRRREAAYTKSKRAWEYSYAKGPRMICAFTALHHLMPMEKHDLRLQVHLNLQIEPIMQQSVAK